MNHFIPLLDQGGGRNDQRVFTLSCPLTKGGAGRLSSYVIRYYDNPGRLHLTKAAAI